MQSLPTPVARFREVATRHRRTRLRSVAIETEAWMRPPRGPRIPLHIRMMHLLGEAFVHEIAIGRGRLAVPFGMDAHVDGRGCMRVGRSLQRGPAFDQGALVALWCEALGFPESWDAREDVSWSGRDEATAVLTVPGPEGPLPITVTFDPATGLPVRSDALRHKGDGPAIGWTGTTTGWREFDGILVPARFEARWSDEARPWIDIRTVGIVPDAPTGPSLDRARRLLAS